MSRRLSLVVALLVLLPTLMVGTLPALAAPGGKSGDEGSQGKSSGKDKGAKKAPTGPNPYSQTKTLTRVFENADGSSYEFDPRTVTVNVDQTTNLRGRQRVNVSWSGAQPSGGRASDPYGLSGMQQEYPVMILQCRGTDDASLPLEQQVRPETCFTSSFSERSQVSVSGTDSGFLHDADAPDQAKQRLSGVSPFPGNEVCTGVDTPGSPSHLTPFVAANGKVYPACSSSTMPPEAGVGAAFPPNEIAAFSDEDGKGSVRFEVRSDVENESLGCSDTVACSIVVVPINGLSCEPAAPRSADPTAAPTESASPSADPSAPPSSDEPSPSSSATSTTEPSPTPTADEDDNGESEFTVAEASCRKSGRFLPGSSNFAKETADLATSPALWWAASNWKNRFAVPVTFGLPPDTCDVLDPRPPTGFYGSEILAQAALQWAPAYCLDKKRFKFQLNQTSDAAGFKLMESGGGAAAIVSGPHKAEKGTKVGYAPTAISGFGIGYSIDLPGNDGEFTDLRLNARLLAKLLFQSYVGSELGRTHPGLENNPLGIMSDPEFISLNPGLSTVSQEAGATLLSLSNDSDIVEQVTEYIAADPEAMAWIKGQADPWGMVINPAYRKIKLPRQTVPLLDSFIPSSNNLCRQANPAVYFTQLAAPVTTLRKISDALLDGWPNVQTRCDFDLSTNTFKLGRGDRQAYGSRFVLGLVSLGDADRYGLRTAALQTSPGLFVGATSEALDAGVKLAAQAEKRQPFILDQAKVRKDGSAYPGTMIVYTAAKLEDAVAEDAAKVAQFINVSTTEGQVRGSGNGELPAGFLPIRRTGVTGKLWRSAREVAQAVSRSGATTDEGGGDGGGKAPAEGGGTASGGGVLPPPSDPGLDAAADDATGVEAAAGDLPASEPVAMPRTAALTSGLASRLLPLLLVLGLLGLGGAVGTRFLVRPSRGGDR